MNNPFKRKTVFDEGYRYKVKNQWTGLYNCFKTKKEAETFISELNNPIIEKIDNEEVSKM